MFQKKSHQLEKPHKQAGVKTPQKATLIDRLDLGPGSQLFLKELGKRLRFLPELLNAPLK